MAVKGSNFIERRKRLIRAYGSTTDERRERALMLAFNRLNDHIRPKGH